MNDTTISFPPDKNQQVTILQAVMEQLNSYPITGAQAATHVAIMNGVGFVLRAIHFELTPKPVEPVGDSAQPDA